MAEEKKEEIAVIEITEEYMKERIYEIRGQRVILDSDLSEIYGYTTKAFNQQVKNNIEKFGLFIRMCGIENRLKSA